MTKILFFLLLIVFIRGSDDTCLAKYDPPSKSDCFSLSTADDNSFQCCFMDFKSNDDADEVPSCYQFRKGKSNAELVEDVKEDYPDATDIKVVCEGDPIEEEHTNKTSYLKIGILFILCLLF